MSKYLKNTLADYLDGDRKAIENASFIRMDTSRTIGGDKDFDTEEREYFFVDKVVRCDWLAMNDKLRGEWQDFCKEYGCFDY